MQQDRSAEPYTGRDVLEVMTEAVNYNRWLCQLVDATAAGTRQLVDFGAGSGTFAAALRDRGYEVGCIELDDRLREGLERQGFRALKQPGELATGSVACIYSLNVLEHIEDAQGAMDELARLLAARGRLLVYVPAFQLLYSSFDRRIGHVLRYRRGQLRELVERAGLQVEEARYADSLGFLASLAYKWFGSADGALNPRALRFYDRVLFPVSRVLDRLFDRLFGKNVLVIASKPG